VASVQTSALLQFFIDIDVTNIVKWIEPNKSFILLIQKK